MYITYCNTFTNVASNDVTSLALSQSLSFRQTLLNVSVLALEEGTSIRRCNGVCAKCLSMSQFLGHMDTDRLHFWLNRPTMDVLSWGRFTRFSAITIKAATRIGV